MTRYLTALFLLQSIASIGLSEEHPEKLLGFLTANTRVGLVSHNETNICDLTILTSDQFELEHDVATLTQKELFEKHPDVAAKANASLKGFADQLRTKKSELPSGTRYGDPKIEVGTTIGSLHKIVYLGNDYILLETVGDQPRRFVLNTAFIHKIQWYHGPNFVTSVRHLRGTETEP
ncbi:hypothetical protein [Aureliella helgolandensis]|uniref:Uncharacterized protein n=1 Tax=Aureliella helgolandensis TaxID=2527968 RepID=A0A518GB49_9BACT|nr:hypothetical protein [Aureliella helgolandensis]QDV25799.1 hypothetical protein Q31a_41260 [Aureliella helgolandensis]